MRKIKADADYHGFEIAVIGMSCRFPNSQNPGELWQNLLNGKNMISFFSKEELKAFGASDELLNDPDFIRAKGYLEDADAFDGAFFNYSPAESENIEPQERLFHECAWSALEDAGYNPDNFGGLIGIFAGAYFNLSWSLRNIIKNGSRAKTDLNQFDDKDFMATRVSYRLNLKGPSVFVQSACSTSLSAVHLACRSLLMGESDIALAGGASVKLPLKFGHLYQSGGVYSPDGYLRPFDQSAAGIVDGDGVGVVVLKVLQKAVADGDNIYAVLKGSAINNDGSSKVGYHTPSVEGQIDVIRTCLNVAEVESGSIDFIECHGTGTPLGDKIEIEALKQAFDAGNENKCAIGSAKANFGHTANAAGILGLMKVILSIQNKTVPPNINFIQPPHDLGIENSPFFVNNEVLDLSDRPFPLRGAVSSFGIGGTNAHIIIEEPPVIQPAKSSEQPHIFTLSAKNGSALDRMENAFLEFLKHNPGIDINSLCHTLHIGRKAFEHRVSIVSSSVPALVNILSEPGSPRILRSQVKENHKNIVFMFPGQGAQYINMGKGLFETEPLFARNITECLAIAKSISGIDYLDLLYPVAGNENSARLDQINVSPVVTFSVEYSLAKLLIDKGVQPASMIGHSIGEYVAACIAEVFSLSDAMRLIIIRGQLMTGLPPGSMISIPLPAHEIQTYIDDTMAIAADHGSSCIVSGHSAQVQELESRLKSKRIICQYLNIYAAGHSAVLDPILEDFSSAVARVTLNAAKIPFISNVTGDWITEQDVTDPGYWVRQLRQTVRYYDGIMALINNGTKGFLEVGPGNSLSMMVAQCRTASNHFFIVNLLKQPLQTVDDQEYFYGAISKLWLNGVKIDWDLLNGSNEVKRISLPTYPFERKRFDADTSLVQKESLKLSQSSRKENPEDWFYIPSWIELSISGAINYESIASQVILLFMDDLGIGEYLYNRLEGLGAKVVKVSRGEDFNNISKLEYCVKPSNGAHYDELFMQLANDQLIPTKIIHLWLLTGNSVHNRADDIGFINQMGYYSLLNLAQAIGSQGIDDAVEINVFTNGMQDGNYTAALFPEKSLVLGAIKVIPREYPNLYLRSVDFDQKLVALDDAAEIYRVIVNEMVVNDGQTIVAYRKRKRYIEKFLNTQIKGVTVESRIRTGGVYLITGGLGGIGLTISSFLAEKGAGKVVLLSRKKFPEKQDWQKLKDSPLTKRTLQQQLVKLEEIESQGAEVRVLEADVSIEADVRNALRFIYDTYGSLNGVVHCAGVFDGNIIQQNTPELSEKVFAAKVRGTLLLDQYIQTEHLDFFVLCSSLNAHLAMMGQVNYCAANIFLDKFSKTKTLNSGVPTLSINWDSWKEVGGAVETIRQLDDQMNNTSNSVAKYLEHPLFHSCTANTDVLKIYVLNIGPDDWVVNEHRILGIPTLPGVTYIELLTAAYKDFMGQQSPCLQINELYVLKPLTFESKKEVQLILSYLSTGWEFKFVSQATSGVDLWEECAKGTIANSVRKPSNHRLDIATLKRMMYQNDTELAVDRLKNNQVIKFGPRWTESFSTRLLGNEEGMVSTILPDSYRQDLLDYHLHPAILDHSFGIFEQEGGFVPFSYQNIYVNGELGKKQLSHIERLSRADRPGHDFVNYKITTVNEDGDVIISVDNYSLVRIDVNRLKQEAEISQPATGQPLATFVNMDKGQTAKSEFSADFLKDGLSCKEGVEVFNRLIHSSFPQVLVSTRDYDFMFEALKNQSLDMLDEMATDRATMPRPNLNVKYVAPLSDGEIKLAQIWEEILGLETVGVNDNFFDLGASSLILIQAAARIKKRLNIKVQVVVLYTHNTVKELADFLFQEPVEKSSAQENTAKRDALEKRRKLLKNEL